MALPVVAAAIATPVAYVLGLRRLVDDVRPSRAGWIALALCACVAIAAAFRGDAPGAILLCGAGACAASDLRWGVVLDAVVAVVLVAVLLAVAGEGGTISALSGVAALVALMCAIRWAGRGGMGWGDVKLAAVPGAALGAMDGAYALALAFVGGGVAAAFLLATKKATRTTALPFAPFVAAGAAAIVLYRDLGAYR